MNNLTNFKQDVLWRFVQVFGRQGVSFFIFFTTALLLTPYDFGVYSYVMAVALIVSMLSDFGVSTTIANRISVIKQDASSDIKREVSSALVLVLVISVLFSFVVLLLGSKYFGVRYDYILLTLPIFFILPLVSLFDGVCRGLGKIKEASKYTTLASFLALPFVYILTLWYGIYGALISQIFLNIGVLCGVLYVGFISLELPSKKNILNLFKQSSIIGLISLSYLLYTKIDNLYLGNFLFFKELGYYEIANKIQFLLIVPFLTVAQVIAPRVSKQLSNVSGYSLLKDFKKVFKISIFLGVTVSFLCAIIFYIIKNYFYLNTEEGLEISIYVTLFLFIFQSTTDLIGNSYIIASGHTKLNLVNLLIFGTLNTIMVPIFLHYYGYYGFLAVKLFLIPLASVSLIYFYFKKINY